MDNMRRAAEEAPKISQKAPGRCEAVAFARSRMDQPMRDLVAAGGLSGFTPAEMFPERAA